jgi:hypothetical protein
VLPCMVKCMAFVYSGVCFRSGLCRCAVGERSAVTRHGCHIDLV